MTTKPRKDRIDAHKNSRNSSNDKNAKIYTTSSILCQLKQEREMCSYVSKEYLAENDGWINKFSTFPEIEFSLVFEDNDFMVDVLKKDKNYIETIVYPKKRRGRSLLSRDLFRSKRVSVYLSDEELAKLENSAKHENMSISAFLRGIGLNRNIPQKPAKLDLLAYSELSRSASNLNQIAKHLNLDPETIHELNSIKSALSGFRRSLISARTEGSNEE